MSESQISVSAGGICFSGPDATELFRAMALKSAIRAAKMGMMITRGMTLTKSLAMAERYTGKKYKRTQADAAIADIEIWCNTMKSALPVVHN